MTHSQPSPRPWTIVNSTTGVPVIHIHDATGRRIFSTYGTRTDMETDLANAALIVQAVNVVVSQERVEAALYAEHKFDGRLDEVYTHSGTFITQLERDRMRAALVAALVARGVAHD